MINNLCQEYLHACFEIKVSERENGLKMASIRCDHFHHRSYDLKARYSSTRFL